MNIHYKVIWNEALGAFTAVSELARSHNKKVSSNTNRTTHRIDARLPCCGLKILVTALMITGLSGHTWAAGAYCVTDADKIAGLGQNSTGTNAVACGQGAQATGDWSIAIGSSAKASGSKTVAIGQNAGSGNTGANNVFIGDTSGANNLAGKSNTFVGGMNTGSETEGSWSAAFGQNSLYSTKGDFNTGLGSYAGQRGSGNSNTSVGSWSGILVTGNNNTALGFFAGTADSKGMSSGSFVGNNNLSLGYLANYVPVGVTVKRNNTVALGAFSSVTQDGGVALGAGSVASTEKGIKGYDPATDLPRVWTAAEAAAIKVAEDNLTAARNNLAAQASGTPGYDAAVSALYAAQTQLSQLIKTWQSTAAAVSVGDNADGTTRQITNLAAGSADTDAVNVAQLKAARTHYFSINPPTTLIANYNNDGATGDHSMAIGFNTLAKGEHDTFIGNAAGFNNTPKKDTINSGTTDGQSVGVGSYAGQRVEGSQNTSLGFYAGALSQGWRNTSLGNTAGLGVTGNNNIATGYETGQNVQGNANIATGFMTGQKVTGDNNIASGYRAGSYTEGHGNLAFGAFAATVLKENPTNPGTPLVDNGNVVQIDEAKIVKGSFNTAIGLGAGGSVSGNNNIATGVLAGVQVSGSDNIASGALAGQNITGSENIAIGKKTGNNKDTTYKGSYNIAVGAAAGNNVQGSNNTAIGRFSGSNVDTAGRAGNTALGYSTGNSVTGGGNTALGNSAGNKVTGDNNVALGRLAGRDITASGTVSVGYGATGNADNAIAIGSYLPDSTGWSSVATQASAKNAIAIGAGARVTGENSIAVGVGNVVHAARSGTIGDPTTIVADATDSYSIGNNNTVNTANTFVLGNAVTTSVANSVYLGKGATAASGLTAQSAGMSVYNSSIINGITYNYAGGTPVGVVSVGAVGAERRIQNVAAGLIAKDSTDAINGSQLYAVLQNAGWNLHTNGSTGTGSGGGTGGTPPAAGASTPNVALGDTVNITDGKNTTVSKITTTPADGSKPATHTYHIDVTGMPISYTDQDGNPIYQKADGTFADKDGKTVTPTAVNTQLVGTTTTTTPKLGNVADGTIAQDSKDAVNGGQLYTVQQAAQQAKTTVSAGDNIVVTSTKNPDGSSNYAVATKKDLTVDSVKAGNTTVDNSGLTIKDGPKITQKNVDMGNQQIHGVAAGTADTDAVNVGQMNKALANVGGNMNELNNRITQVGKDADAGSASAMAVAGLPQAYLPGKSMMAISSSTYNGQTGFAIGVSTITDGGAWVFKGTATGNSQGRYGATVGAGYQW